MRCGMPPILRILGDRHLPASTSINAGVVDAYPQCAEAMLEAGWEFVGHGMHQKSMQAVEDEAALIAQALDKLKAFCGYPIRGWLSPGLRQTDDTPDILKSLGVEYLFDWVIDDLPVWLKTSGGPLIAMPYNLELNDSVVYAVEAQPSDELYRRFTNTLAAFEPELKRRPRVLALGLHPHLIGVPHRIGMLERMVDDLLARDDTVFMTGAGIAEWFRNAAA